MTNLQGYSYGTPEIKGATGCIPSTLLVGQAPRRLTKKLTNKELIISSCHKKIAFVAFFICLFCLILALTIRIGNFGKFALIWYGLSSIVCFVAYAKDKSAARNKTWRVKERTLLLLGLLGGWPGALIAQKIFRHKTQNIVFQRYFWASIFCHCLALVIFATCYSQIF